MGRPLGQFDCSENREFKLPHIEQSLDLNTGRALARKRVKHSVGPLGKAGAQVQFEQRVENKTAPLEDPQSSHQREPKEGIERVATPGARELEDTIALAQPVVHINERITTKDAQAQTEGEIVKEVVRPEIPELSKQIETGIDDVEIGDGDVANVIPQVLAQTEETTRELPTGGEVPTPTNPPAEIVHKNFFPPISEPMQIAVPILKVPPAEIAPKNFSPILAPMQGRVVPTATGSPAEITRENFFTPILQPTQVGNVEERSSAQTSSNKHPMGDRPQEASSQEVEVPSGEYHSLTFAQHPIAGGSSSKVESVIGCPVVGHQGLYHPPVFYSPPSEEATHVNVGEILKLISPSSIIPTSQSPVDPLATTGAPVSAARNVARSVAELCGLDDKATTLMETAFNKYPNLMIIRSDRRKTFIRWMFCSLSDLLQLLSTASTGTLDVLKISEIEDVLRELETFGFDAGFIFEMRLQVREARFAVDNATFDLKALCTKAEGLNLEIEIMESNIAAAKAEVARVEAKINTLCDFVEENRNPVFKWIQQN